METVKLSSKGQIVIPKQFRQACHLSAGMEFSVALVNGEIRLQPLPYLKPAQHNQAAGCLHQSKRGMLTTSQTDSAIAGMLKQQDDDSKTSS